MPMRTHEGFLADARWVQLAPTVEEGNRLAKECGVKGVPILSTLSSISFPHSFPYDFMHLIWENVMKNLFAFWKGKFKNLDEGVENYVIPPNDWSLIGEDSAASARSIPYSFGPAPFNMATKKKRWTADLCSLWTLYVGPIVLKDRLPEEFYNHFIDLVKLLHICMAWEYTDDDIETLCNGFVTWVEDYEQYVFWFTKQLKY